MGHAMSGHLSYLNGVWSDRGRAAYFPIVAAHKVPIGIGVILLLGLASFASVSPRWSEWGLVLPLLACTALALTSKINIGFRHFLPAYAFMLMQASRTLARPRAASGGTGVDGGHRGRGSFAVIPSRLSLLPERSSAQGVPDDQRQQR